MNTFCLLTVVLFCATNKAVNAMSIAEAEANGYEYVKRVDPHKIAKRAAVVKSSAQLWPQGVVYYMIDPKLDSALVQNASWVFNYLYQTTCLTFVPFNSFYGNPTLLTPQGHRSFVNVTVSQSEVCWVDVGFPGSNKVLTMYLGSECANNIHNMAHMALHVLGFYHEHQRPDRDTYINVFWQNIGSGLAINYQKYPVNQTDFSSPYDISSIMHFKSTFDQKSSALVMQPLQYLYWTSSATQDNLGGNMRVDTDPFSHRDLARLNTIYNCGCVYKNVAATCGSTSSTADVNTCTSNYGFIDTCCKCTCPDGFTGQNCEIYDTSDVTDSCGGVITSGDGVITSPNFPANYKTGITCRYLLKNPDKTGKVCFLIHDLSLYSDADSFYASIYYPGVDTLKLETNMSVNYLQKWYQSQTEMASIVFMARYSCPSSQQCNNKGIGFKVIYNIGCKGLSLETTTQQMTWNSSPLLAYIGLFPSTTLKTQTCMTIPCVSDGNCAADKNVWDTYMCGCSAIAGEDMRCQPQYNIQTFHLVAKLNATYISTLSDSISFDYYTLKARICNWVYAGIQHLVIAQYYRSCFRVTAKSGSVIVDYTFAFNITNTAEIFTADQLALSFKYDAAVASESKLNLVSRNDFTITDVDECADLSLWSCPPNSQCINTQGRYTCSCNTGCHYVWSLGARDLGTCVCDGISGPNPNNNGNSFASSSSNYVFQWWWIVVGVCSFLFLVCCCLPFLVYYWRRRRAYVDEQLEEPRRPYRRWSSHSRDSPDDSSQLSDEQPRRLPRTIIRTMPRTGPPSYFI